MKIAIIGGGNLGSAMAEGLLAGKFSKAADLIVTKRNLATLQSLKEKKISITTDNAAAVKKSQVVILAVKPFELIEVLNGIRKELDERKLLISVVTGISILEMDAVIKKTLPIFRAMPN